MDQIRDFDAFKRLVMRLSTTLDKFATDELIESWWKSLRTEKLSDLERRVDAFIAQAKEGTKFPRPSQFRTGEAQGFDARDEGRDSRINEDSRRNWKAFVERFPTTGRIRIAMAEASRIMVNTHEGSPAYAEAFAEYLALEKQLGEHGRFAADC